MDLVGGVWWGLRKRFLVGCGVGTIPKPRGGWIREILELDRLGKCGLREWSLTIPIGGWLERLEVASAEDLSLIGPARQGP